MSIKEVDELHEIAMNGAEEAIFNERKGYRNKAKELYRDALYYEERAANLLLDKFDIEPTRSVLFKSAAWLAYKSDDYDKVKILVKHVFEGNPDNIIVEEMNTLLDKIKG